MFDLLKKPLQKLEEKGMRKKRLAGFYRIRIVNRSKHVIWLAKNTVGDLHDIIPPGRSLEIRLPLALRMEFYAYKASSNLAITGLDYYSRKEFTQEAVWVIQ